MTVYDSRTCKLGEGPLWHPLREQLFWFDVLSGRLLTRGEDGPQEWSFGEPASAAGWIDRDRLLVATASGLWQFDIEIGTRERIVTLEANNPLTRSNDGRADPWGGFWIGTMGLSAELEAGAIYRYYRGKLRKLHTALTIPNAICFSPDRIWAYYADTSRQVVMRQRLESTTGWPNADPTKWLDFREKGLPNPDGAVTDVNGNLWIAHWGAFCVAQYASNGEFIKTVDIPAEQVSCPAFGGPGFKTLFVTSANVGLDAARCAAEPAHGLTFSDSGLGPGIPEPQVIL